MVIDPATTIGAVHLTISDLRRSIRFYETHLGFTVHRRDDRSAWLGAGAADLLILTQCETAPRVRGTTGLYHFAILVPSRADLARSLRRLVATHTILQGAADHGVSEALYLADEDGIGIEIYRDRPREQWPIVDGQLRMGADPFDLDALLEEAGRAESTAGLASGTVIGHVHLHVSRLDAAQAFYIDLMGFELMQREVPQQRGAPGRGGSTDGRGHRPRDGRGRVADSRPSSERDPVDDTRLILKWRSALRCERVSQG